MKQDQIEKISKGKHAEFVLEQITPVLSEQQTTVIAKMKNSYLAGKYTEASLIACVAELVAIDAIEANFRHNVVQKNRVIKQEEENARREENRGNNSHYQS